MGQGLSCRCTNINVRNSKASPFASRADLYHVESSSSRSEGLGGAWQQVTRALPGHTRHLTVLVPVTRGLLPSGDCSLCRRAAAAANLADVRMVLREEVVIYLFSNCPLFGKNASLDWLLLPSPHVYFEIVVSFWRTLLYLPSGSSDSYHQSPVSSETRVGWQRLFSVCGAQFTSCSVFACCPARVLQGITCSTTCEHRHFLPVLQSLNFYEKHFVSKGVIGLPKEKQEFLSSPARGGQWQQCL